MKKVLIITYYWPPSGGPGVQRTLKFVKYFSQFGFKCDVITVDPHRASYSIKDFSLINEIPENVNIYTTNTREPIAFYVKLTKNKEIPYPGFANESNPGFFQKMARFIRGNIFVPDARKGWNKYVYRQAKELIKENTYQSFIISSPPHSTQLIGLKLKKEFNIRWIADMRDPWTDISYYKEMFHLPFIRKKDKNYEKSVLENADNIIVVSDEIKKIFIKKSKLIDPNKIHVIPNGYDEEDFNIPSAPSSENFIVTYTGTIADNYNINIFFKALTKIKNQFSEIPILIKFVGKTTPAIISQIAENKLESITEFISHVSHRESIKFIMNSTVLFLAIPDVENNEGILTGKLFEYLASRKPIINIGPVNGNAAEIIKECDAGKTFDYSDSVGLYEYILELVSQWKSNKNIDLTGNEFKKYSRKELTHQLSDLL